MNRQVIFRPAAEREMLEAERWFEERHSELGQRFRDSVDATIERIRQFPLAFQRVHGDKRRAMPVFEPNAEKAPRPAEGRSVDEGERVVLEHSRIVPERENRAKATRLAALVLLSPALTA